MALIADQHGVAVGRRVGDGVGADHACGAGTVLDHDRRGVAGLGKLLLEQSRPVCRNAGRR